MLPTFSNDLAIKKLWGKRIQETGEYPAWVKLADHVKKMIDDVSEDYPFSDKQIKIKVRKKRKSRVRE